MLSYNGKVYARVSDVLQPFVNFGGINKDILDAKALLGTNVHQAIQQVIQGELPVLQPNGFGYLESFKKWRAAISPDFTELEVRYYDNRKMITGAVDTIIKLHGEEKGIIVDWKTSAQESPITWPMQAHLYHYLVVGSDKEISDKFLFVKLDKYGNMPTVFKYKFDKNLQKKCFEAVDSFWNPDFC